jgi:hypothetical protein
MSEVDFNNINLRYRGYKISIAQHKLDDWIETQEIAFWPEDKDPRDCDMTIYHYGRTLTSLMRTLQSVREDIDNEWSCYPIKSED